TDKGSFTTTISDGQGHTVNANCAVSFSGASMLVDCQLTAAQGTADCKADGAKKEPERATFVLVDEAKESIHRCSCGLSRSVAVWDESAANTRADVTFHLYAPTPESAPRSSFGVLALGITDARNPRMKLPVALFPIFFVSGCAAHSTATDSG